MPADLAIVEKPLQGEVLPPGIISPHECDQRLRSAAKTLKNSLMEIAYYGWRMRLGDHWAEFGCDSEDQYRESIDIPRSTWYKFLRIGQVLHEIPYRDLQQIPTTNAELLMQVSPELWQDYPWVQEAKRLKPSDFALQITQRNRSVGNDRQPMTYFRVKVPYTLKEFLETTIEVFRQRNGLSTIGQALEFLIADRHDRPNVMLLILEARGALTKAIHLLEDRHIIDINEEKFLLKKARNLIDEAREIAVSEAREAAGDQGDEGWDDDNPAEYGGARGEATAEASPLG